MLAQKERGLELSEQFDEKILQVLARVSHSALEFPLYAWAHARRNWSVMRKPTLKLHPPPRATPGNFLCPICRVARRAAFRAISVTCVFYGTGFS